MADESNALGAPTALVDLARNYCVEQGGASLLPIQAKLYSQHVRLRDLGQSLQGWKPSEADDRLDDAIRLLATADAISAADGSLWISAVRRSAEILEWLAHPELNSQRRPLRLMAAAAYQVGGYPARAAGLWGSASSTEGESPLLSALLRANFPSVCETLAALWSRSPRRIPAGIAGPAWSQNGSGSSLQEDWFVREVGAAIGVITAAMRWGDEERLPAALRKLGAAADLLLHGVDRYSWLLGNLCKKVAADYIATSLRRHVASLRQHLSEDGQIALERYVRRCYLGHRTIAWPTQVEGIARLASDASFALCTPTGSGKTAVAELAILKTLFRRSDLASQSEATALSEQNDANPRRRLALYLTPSRALAAEVEGKMAATIKAVTDRRLVVTGLYGGTDWGPSDAWLTLADPTVLICTYEKAEALLRFLGPAFVPQVGLVIVDEAHFIQCEEDGATVRAAETREFGAESLLARLLASVQSAGAQVVALSAVAAGIEVALACWLADSNDATPIRVQYRSTRQLIGRLECFRDGHFAIRYNLLDGNPLEFREGNLDDTPYLLRPFAPVPRATVPDWTEGRDIRLRPSIIWAALQMAAKDTEGSRHSVLVYVTQQPEYLARTALALLRDQWGATELPDYFELPHNENDRRLWEGCLRSCADYFGEGSDEHELLLRGVIVHRGKLPGGIARQLVALIEQRIIHVVIATYTLAEGVNLPFETVIIPTLARGAPTIPVTEFLNVAGRAGRPGAGTEGRCLIAWDASDRRSLTRWRYNTLLTELAERRAQVVATGKAQSALAALLQFIETEWRRLTGSADRGAFLEWLETVAPLAETTTATTASRTPSDAVDSLDAFLIAAVEDAHGGAEDAAVELDLATAEERITRVWRRTFARFASAEQNHLEEMVVRRGRSLVNRIYPDRRVRRQYYMSSLPPKQARDVVEAFPGLRAHLESGREYALWGPSDRLTYVLRTAELVDGLPKFRFSEGPRQPPWREVLHWWLHRESASVLPRRNRVTQWLKYVDDNFVVRLTWGLGSTIALAAEERPSTSAQPLSAEAWESVGLPWAAFWMRDMLTWGTLEPAAAYLLTCQLASTRGEAEALAQGYAAAIGDVLSPDDRLNALHIREWAEGLRRPALTEDGLRPPHEVPVVLERDFSTVTRALWRVLPVERQDGLDWCDPAGYVLARSVRPTGWLPWFLNSHDAVLDVRAAVVRTYSYSRAGFA